MSPGEEKSENYQWTIMGSVFAFIVGTILGIFLMVFWIKQRDRFNLKKIISPRRETIQNQLPPPSGSNKEGQCSNRSSGLFTRQTKRFLLYQNGILAS